MRRDWKVWLASLVCVLLGQLADAAEWKMTGTLNQGVDYDDNISLSADATPVFGYLLQPSLSGNWNKANMNLGITGSGDIRRYDDDSWNCDNFSLGLNGRYLLRRHVFSLNVGYAQSCSYSQQIEDTGILLPNTQTESVNLAPAWSWQWTPLDQLSFRPTYSQISYSGLGADNNTASNLGFQNNTTYGLDLSELHQWNRRLSFTTGLFFSATEYSGTGASNQNMFGFQLGSQYAISRFWSINGGGGGRWVQSPSTFGLADSNNSNSLLFTEIANLDLNYTGRRMSFSIGYSRTVNPSSFGQVLEYNSIITSFSYQLTKELSFAIDGSFLKSQSVGQSIYQTAQDRNYYTASTRLSWNFTKEWQLSASYRFRRQEYPDVGQESAANQFGDAQNSNALMLHLNYNWEGLRFSR